MSFACIYVCHCASCTNEDSFFLYRFELHCTDTNVSKVDITVVLAVKVNQKEGKIVQNLEKIPLK